MRAVQIALLIICIQAGIGLVTVSSLYGDIYYENELLPDVSSDSIDAMSETEQIQASVGVMNRVWDALSWGWVKIYFMPLYNTSSATQSFIDSLILFLQSITGIIIGIALIEFVRNRPNVLGG